MRWIDWNKAIRSTRVCAPTAACPDYNLLIMQSKHEGFHHWHAELPLSSGRARAPSALCFTLILAHDQVSVIDYLCWFPHPFRGAEGAGSNSKGSTSKFPRNHPVPSSPSWTALLGGHSGKGSWSLHPVQDTAAINTWVTNKCVVKGTLIASFVRRVSLWQRRETFVSLFHRWPHGALDKSPPPCFNWPQRQLCYSRSVCSCGSPNLLPG